MLDEIITQLGQTYSDEDYATVVEDVYEDIYDEASENDEYAEHFDEDCSFELKELITSYLNHENFRDMTRDANEKIDKKIANALKTLEKYDTPEYALLREHGFCDPSSERAPYEGSPHEEWHVERKRRFAREALKLDIQESRAQKIVLGLESLI
jgi:hypothetical protein